MSDALNSNDGSMEKTVDVQDLPEQETSLRPADPLHEIAKLLGDLPPEESPQETEDETPPPASSSPLDADPNQPELEAAADDDQADTVKEMAEKLGVDPQKLYKVKIGIPGGEPVSLEDLKKSYVSRADAERELISKDDALAGREAALNRDLNMARELLAEANIAPGKVQELQAKQTEALQREREALMATVPEFKEGAAFDEFKGKATELMSSYGLRPQEQNITDHRVVLMIRDFIRTRERLDRLLKMEPEAKQPPKPAKARVQSNTKGAQIARSVARARTGTEADKLAAVEKLLGG